MMTAKKKEEVLRLCWSEGEIELSCDSEDQVVGCSQKKVTEEMLPRTEANHIRIESRTAMPL